jgi:hypothetical protein
MEMQSYEKAVHAWRDACGAQKVQEFPVKYHMPPEIIEFVQAGCIVKKHSWNIIPQIHMNILWFSKQSIMLNGFVKPGVDSWIACDVCRHGIKYGDIRWSVERKDYDVCEWCYAFNQTGEYDKDQYTLYEYTVFVLDWIRFAHSAYLTFWVNCNMNSKQYGNIARLKGGVSYQEFDILYKNTHEFTIAISKHIYDMSPGFTRFDI